MPTSKRSRDDNENPDATRRILRNTKVKRGKEKGAPVIPRKENTADALSIPLKAKSEEPKEEPSLLTQSMLPAALAPTPQQQSPDPAPRDRRLNRGEPPPVTSKPSPPEIPPPSRPQMSPVRMDPWEAIAPPTAAPPAIRILRSEEERVLSTLKTLCNKINLTIEPTDDLLSGSFSSQDAEPESFFDLNEKGEIVLPPRIPIFPEDLAAGQKPWPLSWWGIVDPLVNDESSARRHGKSSRSSRERSSQDRHGPSKERSDQDREQLFWDRDGDRSSREPERTIQDRDQDRERSSRDRPWDGGTRNDRALYEYGEPDDWRGGQEPWGERAGPPPSHRDDRLRGPPLRGPRGPPPRR